MAASTAILARSGVSRLGAAMHRSHVGVVAYHGVPDRETFEHQLDVFSRYGNVITPSELRAALSGNPLPSRPILLTFDDGDPSVLDNAAPVLADRGLEAMIFVVGGLVDTVTPFWWDEVAALTKGTAEVTRLKAVPNPERLARIEELRSAAPAASTARQLTTRDLRSLQTAGFEIGNHTHLHPCLDKCTEIEAIGNVRLGHQALVDRGITPTAFAYPNGNLDTRVEPTLHELGYDLGFLYDHHHTRLDQHRLRLSRLRLDASADPNRAELIISGVLGAIMRMRRRG